MGVVMFWTIISVGCYLVAAYFRLRDIEKKLTSSERKKKKCALFAPIFEDYEDDS